MTIRHRTAGALFWCMIAAAFATLAPCLILPAWLDYRQARQLQAARRELVERLSATIAAQQKQIEHLQHDEAYNERILREEIGLETPGVATIYVESPRGAPDSKRNPGGPDHGAGTAVSAPGHVSVSPRPEPASVSHRRRPAHERFPLLSAAAEQAVTRYPRWVQPFVQPRTRVVLSGASFALLLAAVVLLGDGRPGRSGESATDA